MTQVSIPLPKGKYTDAKQDLLHGIWDQLSYINGKQPSDLVARNVTGGFSNSTEDVLAQIHAELARMALPLRNRLTGVVNVRDFGAVGDGVTDDTQAIADANAFAQASKKELFFDHGYTYKCSAGFSVNVTKTRWSGRARLDFTALTTGIAITVTGSGDGSANPYFQNYNGIDGLELFGDRTKPVIGLKLTSPQEPASSHTSYENLNIHDFATGIQLSNNSYLLDFYNLDLHACNLGVEITGTINCGENYRFWGGAVYQCTLAYRHNNASSDTSLFGTSIDHCDKVLDNLGGRINWYGVHMEGVNYASYPVTTSGDGSTLVWHGGLCVCTDTTVKPAAYFNVGTPDGYGGGVWVKNVTFDGTGTTSGFIADGTGGFYPENLSGYNVGIVAKLTAKKNNRLLDGSFEDSAILDALLVTGSGANTDPYTAPNSVVVQSNTYARTGSKSLKHTKAGGASTESAFRVYAPIRPGLLTTAELYYKKPGTSTGTVWISFYFVGGYRDQNGTISYQKRMSLGTDAVTLSAAAKDWTKSETGSPQFRAPAWATHFCIEINAYPWNGGGESMYYDDFFIGQS